MLAATRAHALALHRSLLLNSEYFVFLCVCLLAFVSVLRVLFCCFFVVVSSRSFLSTLGGKYYRNVRVCVCVGVPVCDETESVRMHKD